MTLVPVSAGMIADIVNAEWWGNTQCTNELVRLVVSGELELVNLRLLDRLLRLCHFHRRELDAAAIAELTANWNVDSMRRARRAMWQLFEQSPVLRTLDEAIAARSSKPLAEKHAYKPRARKYSVFPQELPEEWQSALKRMEAGSPGVLSKAPVQSMIVTTRTKLCEFALAARAAGLDVAMTVEAATAYERSLAERDRPLSRVTLHSAMRQIRDFARYLGADEAVLAHLAARVGRHENRAKGAVPQKEAKVLALPSYAEIFGMACDFLGRADETRNPRAAQALRNTAVAISLFCPFPFRVADTRLNFGRDILWDESGYRFHLTISKTRRPFSAPVLPVFGFFLDQMILQGSSTEHLDALREKCFETQRPLFVNHANRPLHERYVSYLWQQTLGTGSHAVRTKLHDEFGRLGTRGVELAMRACGHRSEKTAEAYRTRAFERLAIERVHADLAANITDAEWRKFFGQR